MVFLTSSKGRNESSKIKIKDLIREHHSTWRIEREARQEEKGSLKEVLKKAASKRQAQIISYEGDTGSVVRNHFC